MHSVNILICTSTLAGTRIFIYGLLLKPSWSMTLAAIQLAMPKYTVFFFSFTSRYNQLIISICKMNSLRHLVLVASVRTAQRSSKLHIVLQYLCLNLWWFCWWNGDDVSNHASSGSSKLRVRNKTIISFQAASSLLASPLFGSLQYQRKVTIGSGNYRFPFSIYARSIWE